jgi:small subunit ribosomal protein S20
MANTSSAKKAQRGAERRRVFNVRRKKAVKDAGKTMEKFLAAKNEKDAIGMIPALYQAIDKAAKNGTIHANTAARMKSRAAKQLRALSK